jgi:hypothetical protein
MRAIVGSAVVVLAAHGIALSQESGAEKVLRELSCKTALSHMEVHGTQVTYKRPDGTILLWYPGNTVVLPGLWKVNMRPISRPPSEWAEICFFYFTTGLNPATKRPGNEWACIPLEWIERRTVERVQGDVFALTSRSAVPFSLSREKTTISALLEAVHKADRSRGIAPPNKDAECDRTS